MLVVCALAAALADAEPAPSMYAAFSAFAECADSATRALLEKRLRSFAAKTEDEVRALPEHVARNEQEKVLALQQQLVPAGTLVQFDGLAEEQLNGCEAVLLACLRDGSFLCAVETHCGLESDAAAPLHCRVHVANLRPAAGCVVRAAPAAGCEVGNSERGSMEPLDERTIGQLIVDTIMQSRQGGLLPDDLATAFPGDTAFPDLPYAALAAVLVRTEQLGCAALGAGDARGAAEAVARALDLEEQSRPAAADRLEAPPALRFLLARLLALRAAALGAQGDAAAARRAALDAQRLNVTASVSNRKLAQAASGSQRARPHSVTGLDAEESAQLQRWFEALVPLDGEQHAARTTRVEVSPMGH